MGARFFALVAFAATALVSGERRVKAPSAAAYASMGWTPLNSLTSSREREVKITFALRENQSGLDAIENMLSGALADPSHEDYFETPWLTKKEIDALTSPDASAIADVTRWLEKNGAKLSYLGSSIITATLKQLDAENMLGTYFFELTQAESGKRILRAGDYTLPNHVESHIAAVFGMQGLPLPSENPLRLVSPSTPAAVTPDVIQKTYGISGVKVSGSTANTQAVAEFQGEYIKTSDLVDFFSKYVPNAEKGDDAVYKYVGSPNKQEAGTEASLDIQYIMGVAPHVKTEFWEWASMDFCSDLVNYSATMLACESDCPLVHSVSYGWQGNLTQLQCTDDKVKVIDDNFMKIAAKGVSVIFASGDSGSGYSPQNTCSGGSSPGTQNQAISGIISQTANAASAAVCCEIGLNADGWMYEPPTTSGPTCVPGDAGTADKVYTEGTVVQTILVPPHDNVICCQIAQERGLFFSTIPDGDRKNCTLYSDVGSGATKSLKGGYSGKPATGKCSTFSTVSGRHEKKGVVSSDGSAPKSIKLWPSWPASSSWITAVGATRFVDQKPGEAEMATDQFGSGGGFSAMFDQPKWQASFVDAYTANPPKDPHYPPSGSFPAKGRATPDVSALGEGYQVYTNGVVSSLGGRPHQHSHLLRLYLCSTKRASARTQKFLVI